MDGRQAHKVLHVRGVAKDGGFVLIAVLAFLLPMALLLGTYTMSMNGRSEVLVDEITQERALLAAESGIDFAVYQAKIGNLKNNIVLNGTLSTDATYSVTPTWLKTDSVDNDGDSLVDEADEDVYQVLSVGTYRNVHRKVVSYLGPSTALPTLNTAVSLQCQTPKILIQGSALISGKNSKLGGGAASSAFDKEGLSIATPATVATLSAELTGAEGSKVQGQSASPSLATTSPVDFAALESGISNSAGIVLTSATYASKTFGDSSLGQHYICYRNGNVKFTGNVSGAGVLFITGNLTLAGNFRWDGVVIVMGDVTSASGTADIYGALVQGPAGQNLTMKGNCAFHYSQAGVDLASNLTLRYVAFNGWQEIAR